MCFFPSSKFVYIFAEQNLTQLILTIDREVQVDLELIDRGDSALPTLRDQAAWRLIKRQKRLLSQPGNCIKPQRRELGAIINRCIIAVNNSGVDRSIVCRPKIPPIDFGAD
jgi:hypothetical protein